MIAAASQVTGHAEGLIAPKLNLEVVNLLLEQFSKSLPDDVHTAVIRDGAGDHSAKAIRCPANVTLVTLAPYSQELNPVENLWHHLRSLDWPNCDYKDIECVVRRRQGWLTEVLPRRSDRQVRVRHPVRHFRSCQLRCVFK